MTTTHRAPNIDGGTFTCEHIKTGGMAGGYFCVAFRGGKRIWMQYLYYTRREVVTLFKQHLAGK